MYNAPLALLLFLIFTFSFIILLIFYFEGVWGEQHNLIELFVFNHKLLYESLIVRAINY